MLQILSTIDNKNGEKASTKNASDVEQTEVAKPFSVAKAKVEATYFGDNTSEEQEEEGLKALEALHVAAENELERLDALLADAKLSGFPPSSYEVYQEEGDKFVEIKPLEGFEASITAFRQEVEASKQALEIRNSDEMGKLMLKTKGMEPAFDDIAKLTRLKVAKAILTGNYSDLRMTHIHSLDFLNQEQIQTLYDNPEAILKVESRVIPFDLLEDHVEELADDLGYDETQKNDLANAKSFQAEWWQGGLGGYASKLTSDISSYTGWLGVGKYTLGNGENSAVHQMKMKRDYLVNAVSGEIEALESAGVTMDLEQLDKPKDDIKSLADKLKEYKDEIQFKLDAVDTAEDKAEALKEVGDTLSKLNEGILSIRALIEKAEQAAPGIVPENEDVVINIEVEEIAEDVDPGVSLKMVNTMLDALSREQQAMSKTYENVKTVYEREEIGKQQKTDLIKHRFDHVESAIMDARVEAKTYWFDWGKSAREGLENSLLKAIKDYRDPNSSVGLQDVKQAINAIQHSEPGFFHRAGPMNNLKTIVDRTMQEVNRIESSSAQVEDLDRNDYALKLQHYVTAYHDREIDAADLAEKVQEGRDVLANGVLLDSQDIIKDKLDAIDTNILSTVMVNNPQGKSSNRLITDMLTGADKQLDKPESENSNETPEATPMPVVEVVETDRAGNDPHVERARSAYQDVLARVDGGSHRTKQELDGDKALKGTDKLQEVQHNTLSH